MTQERGIAAAVASRHGISETQLRACLTVWPRLREGKASHIQTMQEETDATLRTLPRSLVSCAGLFDVQPSAEYFAMCREYEDAVWQSRPDDDDIRELAIDIETFSGADIAACGVYKYAEAADFRVLLFAYSVNGGPVRVVDIESGDVLPVKIRAALTDPAVLKTAYNAAFERVCLSRWLGMKPGEYLDAAQWDCTMVRALRLGLPASLAQCGAALRLPSEERKMSEGRALIAYFCKPCRATSANGGRTRRTPGDAPDKWSLFKRYNRRDVETEQRIRRVVTHLRVTDTERAVWVLDQSINDRGVLIDTALAAQAERMNAEYCAGLTAEARRLTGLQNPNSPAQLKEWLRRATGLDFASIDKATVSAHIGALAAAPRRVLQIRQELGKTSNAKYTAMLAVACADRRARGLFQFYGASRTGRWAGRLLQLQNLPQNHLPDLAEARATVRSGDLDTLRFEYGNVPQTLSELIRTALVAKPGHTFHVCDFSAIEARVIAWLAGEEWVLDTFRKGGDIYCATASQMFGVPVEKHGANAALRQKGKIAVLALGYGGGVSALEKMGGARLGMTDEEMRDTVERWRAANPRIARLWRHAEQAAKAAVKAGRGLLERGITLTAHALNGSHVVAATLPSGRKICYNAMRLGADGRIVFDAQNQTTRQWEETETYGGKLVENLVQAIARDCLAETMLRLDRAGFPIVFHIHDECVIEAAPGQTLEAVEEIFKTPITWAPGLPLSGAGYTTPYYLKD